MARRSSSPEIDPATLSEDLVSSPTQKIANVQSLDFDGLLTKSISLHEDPKNGCGGRLWPAGMVLGKYLLRNLHFLEGRSILELGAGGGLTGLALAAALKYAGKAEHTHINITDQEPMFTLMEKNILLNELPAELVHASILDWGTPLPNTTQPDVILAADCVYFEPAFPLLLNTLENLLSNDAVCYFCFKKRRRADLRFMKNAKKKFKVEDIVDDPDKHIWSKEGLFLYKITKKKE